MKMTKKMKQGAIIGFIWGLISIPILLSGLPEQSSSPSVIYYILSVPAWILVTIGGKIMGTGGGGEQLFLLAPFLGAMIGYFIGKNIKKMKI